MNKIISRWICPNKSPNENVYNLLWAAFLFFLVGCNTSDTSPPVRETLSIEPYTAEVRVVEQEDIINLELSDESTLGDSRNLFVDHEHIIWAERRPPLVAFDADGRFSKSFAPLGSGPGEIGSVDVMVVGYDGAFYVFDGDHWRVSIYGTDYEFIQSYQVKSMTRFPRMAVNDEGIVYFLAPDYEMNEPAVVAYDPNGQEVYRWGELPLTAKIQNNVRGGGIAIDEEDYVYYGYISDHRIFKTDPSGTLVTVFDEVPEHYLGFDEAEVRRMERSPSSKGIFYDRSVYARQRSQVRSLHLVRDRPWLFQLILTPDNKARRMKMSLELWHTDGFKIASDIRSYGSELKFADHQYFYYVDNPSDGTEANPHIRRHRYTLTRTDFFPAEN